MSDRSISSQFTLERGTPTRLEINRPVKFRLVFLNDSYVEGIITPNSGFTVCDNGDFKEVSITIDEESMKKSCIVGSEVQLYEK